MTVLPLLYLHLFLYVVINYQNKRYEIAFSRFCVTSNLAKIL